MSLRSILTSFAIVVAVTGVRGSSAEDAPPMYFAQQAPPACDCVEHSCKLVPEVKQIKKTVYEVQEVPFCVKKLPPLLSLFHHHNCDCEVCAECQCPRYKKVLVKKEIVCKEICTTKCVIEEHRVPCQPCDCGK